MFSLWYKKEQNNNDNNNGNHYYCNNSDDSNKEIPQTLGTNYLFLNAHLKHNVIFQFWGIWRKSEKSLLRLIYSVQKDKNFGDLGEGTGGDPSCPKLCFF